MELVVWTGSNALTGFQRAVVSATARPLRARLVFKSRFPCDTYFEWWDITNPANDDLYDYSYINLSEDFYREIVEGAVPLDMLHLAQISRKPLAIDLYCWATYRISYHKGNTRVTWQQLKAQLGTGYPNTPQGMRDFKKKVIKAIEDVKAAWPEAGITTWENGVRLTGTNPAITKKDQDDFWNDDPNYF